MLETNIDNFKINILKLLVSRYQDIDSKINNFSRLVFDLISKSPIKQRYKLVWVSVAGY